MKWRKRKNQLVDVPLRWQYREGRSVTAVCIVQKDAPSTGNLLSKIIIHVIGMTMQKPVLVYCPVLKLNVIQPGSGQRSHLRTAATQNGSYRTPSQAATPAFQPYHAELVRTEA